MKVIDRNKIENLRYLLGNPDTVKNRYNQMKRTFGQNKEYLIFAEPVYVNDTNSIIWSSSYEGDVINFKHLSSSEQNAAKLQLTKSIQTLLDSANKFETNEFTEFVYNCIEIPSLESIFLIRGKEGDNVVISQWGFVSDEPGMEKGLLAKIINVQRTDLTFQVIYEDETPAPNEKFMFEYEDAQHTHISDENAIIRLSDVRVEENITAQQISDNETYAPQSFTAYEKGSYKLRAIKLLDMVFRVENEAGDALPNESFTFSHNAQTQELSSDENGIIILPKIKLHDEVSAYRIEDGQQTHTHKFVCEDDKKYILRIKSPQVATPKEEKPKEYDMRFRVEDKRGNPIENATVKIKYNGKTVEQTTDAQGYTILKNVTPNTKVKVKAIGKLNKNK